jgi:cytochrome c-type biogenesis protein CcmE
MKRLLWLIPLLAAGQFHRSEQDREIRYWLLEPDTHQFKISHDFTITRVGQKYAHSFVRKGSTVNADAQMYNLDTGEKLKTTNVSGKSVNALGYYPTPTEDDSVVVQGEFAKPIAEGETVRVRCQESYTDPEGYFVRNGELVWSRTLGRPLNYVTLPAGWMLTSLNSPATVTLDSEGRVTLRFTNIRNDNLTVNIHAKKR